MERTRRNIWLTVLGVVLLSLASVSMFVNKLTTPRVMSDAELQLNGAFVFDKPRIIEPFSLLDQRGEPFDLAGLKGRWSLIFFGYTFCPDICPTTLADLKKFTGLLEGTRWEHDTQILLVTVDPARDTPERLESYLAYFDSGFIGLTGEFLAVHAFARNVNAAFTKVPGGDQGSYLVDHTSNIALINPYGHYHGFFKPAATLTQGLFDPGKLKVTYQSIRTDFDG